MDYNRVNKILNLDQYNKINTAIKVGNIEINLPKEDIYILRMPLSQQLDFNEYFLPEKYKFLQEFVGRCIEYQKNIIKIRHPFMYLTIRHGEVKSVTDDKWHVDGFSLRYNHLPEQNYIWCSSNATEVSLSKTDLSEFNPFKENIHKKFSGENTYKCKDKTIYCLDPYVIHRRPPNTAGIRSFIRLSFTPIEIKDLNNTVNPLIDYNKNYDGVKEYRDKLK